ncbi:5'-nucleotidase C-terminal domain-containing protein [Pareuzebyella sediminis]|uniref:5'-nucleotidase C-terminal domain-containing protein n=1 Tax=Pareuzebyella sediminis TaxID=2607998 RepID=UPI0011F0290E|nr:5'-nucleotidase [Pareuzebyella sediminis]
MGLKIKHFVIFITIISGGSCRHNSTHLSQITSSQTRIDSSLRASGAFDEFIAPYRSRLNEVLDSTLAYAPQTITKEDGQFNTSAGNLIADIIFSEANPIFKSRTGKDIDFVLLNHGGIRSIISKGNVSTRTAFEVMPFENSIVVVALDGHVISEMVDFLRDSGQAHPVSGIQIILNSDNTLNSLMIQGKPLDLTRTYNVATSNYLVTGGDNMTFFKKAKSIMDTDYFIRNAIIDYFKKVDTLSTVVDDRFIKLH